MQSLATLPYPSGGLVLQLSLVAILTAYDLL